MAHYSEMGRYKNTIDRGLRRYSHKDLTRKDVMYLVTTYKDLVPSVENFVLKRVSQPRLTLDFTIPVPFKGVKCRVPIALCLQENHPYNPPTVFIKPTTTMRIRNGPYVDSAGSVSLPYLTEWKYPSSDLLGLMNVLIETFGRNHPVFSNDPWYLRMLDDEDEQNSMLSAGIVEKN